MNTTKRSFLTSLVSLVLCFTMFLGTTFAWFTDIVVSGGNIIQSGKLDAEMYWSDEYLASTDSGWTQVKDNKPIFTYDNWEPGYTEIKYIKVANAGNLNFKWKLSIEAEGRVTDLSDVIDVYYVNPVNGELTKQALAARTPDGKLTDVLANKTATEGDQLTPGGSVVLAIAFQMDKLAGNEYQEKSLCDKGFSLKLLATQATGENDSFDDQYDKESEWPENTIIGNTASAPAENVNGLLGTAASMTSADGKISANVPAGTKLDAGASKLTLNVANMDKSKANITLDENEAALSIDVHILGVAKDNEIVMEISVKELLPVGLNMGNYRFYHVENGNTVEMTLLEDGATPVHNNFTYDPVTGDVTLYMASFSEVALVADTENAWEGNLDYSWYDADATELQIANADQLAAFGAIVGGMKKVTERVDGKYTYSDKVIQDSFAGKTVKLIADINIGDLDSENGLVFYPIGYWNNEGTYERKPIEERTTAVSSGFYTFEGTFDGNGHTIANFYQNTWEMKGDHNWYDPIKEQYYRDGMGLFGRVYGGTVKNLTVRNFKSDGEITTTGVIAAYADGATFQNIAIFDCNPRVYNIGNGGIVGCVGWYAKEANLKTTFTNITVDNSNKISALWGSYDVACGGIVGQYYPTSGQTSAGTPKNAGISFENCHVSAVMDVYNDVCANYQYYAYRYAGMIIGSIRENTTNADGKTIPDMTGISATNCTVNYGDWNDYYYCEFEKNGHPSYSGPDDYKFSRVPHSELNFTDSNGNGVVDADERASVTGCKHNHTDKEDNKAIFLPFYQLFTGYGWGVSSIGLKEYSGIVTNLDITEGDQQESVKKFEGKVSKLENGKKYKLGDIFNFVDNGVELIPGALSVGVTNLEENGNVVATIVYDNSNWENGTIILEGAGTVTVTIQDYFFCIPTTIVVLVEDHKHVYDDSCDTTCNDCGEEREVTHKYETEVTAPTCEAEGYTTYTCECGHHYVSDEVPALGHSYNAVVTDPTCTAGGYTTYTCSVCGHSYKGNETAANGHKYNSVLTAPTCTTDGYTTYTCACGDSYVDNRVAALGHKYNSVVTAPTCNADGYTTYTCSGCGDTYTGNDVAALGHITTNFTGNFLYRVGNQNDVELSSLFNVGKHTVTVSGANVAGNASVTVNGTTLKFNGTGVVKVTLTSDCTCGECDLVLNLEVIDATNLTSASGYTGTEHKNFVLVKDISTSSFVNHWNSTIYGNGFTYSLKGGPTKYDSKQGHGILISKNTTFDNIVIIGDVYNSYGAYSNQDHYTAAIDATNTIIQNSYIANCSAPVRGNGVTIINTTLYGGTVANIVLSGGINTFTNLTTVNHKDDRDVLGLGIVVSNEANDNTRIVLNGTLKQYNYVCSSDSSAVPGTEAKAVFNSMFSNSFSDYKTSTGYVNTGIVIMTESLNTDIITDNADTGYLANDDATVTVTAGLTTTVNGAVYAPKGSEASVDNGYSFDTDNHVSTTQGDYLPTFEFDLGDNYNANDGETDTRYCYESVNNEKVQLLYQDGQNGFTFDLTKLVSVTKFGYSLNTTVVCKNSAGVVLATNSTVTLKDAGMYYFEITVSDNIIYGIDGNLTGEVVYRTYTIDVELSVKKASWKNAEIKMSTISQNSGYNSSKYYVLVFLDAISITDYAENGTAETVNLKAEYDSYEITYVNNTSYAWSGFTLTINYKDGRVLTVTFGVPSGLSSPGASAGGKTISLKNDNTYGYVLQSDGKINTKVSGTWSITKCTFKGNNTVTVEKAETIDLNVKSNTTINVQSGSSGGECVTPDTLITLADGTQVRVDSLKGDELLLVWNMETGKLDYAPIMFVDSDPETEYEIIHLYFSDGTEVKVIYEHGFWDYDLNKYVYLDRNAADYIGHTFAKQNGDKLEKVTLTDVVIETELTTAWSPVTVGHLCYFVNGMLSMPGGVGGLFNIFEVDPETMTYDYEQLEKDIETYGLFTYEELNAICPLTEEMFNAAGGAYLKISIGKGNLTVEELIDMINRYSKFI